MPILTNERDAPDRVLARAAQQDPWIMYLVVRQDSPVSADELFAAAAQATMRCDEAYRPSEAWAEAFAAWSERSFRKVCLRAKAAAWAKLDAYDAGRGGAGGRDVVRALPPRLRSQCGALLRNLQVYSPDPASLPPPPAAAPGPAGPAMTFAFNPAVAMSTGKAVAQISHAVLMCARSAWADDPRYAPAFAAWRAADYPVRFAPPGAWAPLRADADGVVVRDAGLTEVDPGTETVLATPPGYRVGA
ncbi:MAG TPA: hypothetical protein VFS43_02670 [Polyangiaceae bacterium]|nr:hypothetical protein [Polyangiaceae bacterium]